MTRDEGRGTRDEMPSDDPWGNGPLEADADAYAGVDGPQSLGGPPQNHDDLPIVDGHHHSSAPIGESTPSVSRRRALQVLGMLPLAGAVSALGAQQTGQQQQGRQGHATPNQPTQPPAPARNAPKAAFFTRAELRTVGVLANDIIPKDSRSGSATDAGVPAFIDFNLSVPETDEATRTAWRGGLRWLDTESKRRFGVGYASATSAQRHAILDDIAYPDKVTPQLRPGNAFFMRARDMVASGFFSSAIGHQDLRWQGNTFNPNWNGCPPEALQKLGVTYDVMTSRVGLKPGD
jgi:gluconate 2-dehydrogenase gamma chain